MSNVARAVGIMLALGGVFIPSAAAAQKAGDMTFGVMAGVSWATVNQHPEFGDVTFHYKPGLVAGVFLGFQVNEIFSVEPQAFFIQKGSKVKGTGSNSSLEGSVRISYIEVPLLGKFWFPVGYSQVKPFIFAGPAVAFKVGCTLEGEILSVTGDEDCDKTSLVKIKSTDFGGTVGGGIQFRAGNQIVVVDARYTHGFTDINDTGDNREIKNRAFAATVGLGFPIGR